MNILCVLVGACIFLAGYWLYHFCNDRYYKKKRAEWEKEMQTGSGNIKTANRIIKDEARRVQTKTP